MTTSSKPRHARHKTLSDKKLRTMLSNMHSAVWTKSNAELVMENDPAEIPRSSIIGEGDSRRAMIYLCGWMRLIKTISYKDAYINHLVRPLQIACRTRKEYAEMAPSSTSLGGWVFAATQDQGDEGDAENAHAVRTNLSLIAPEIQSVISIRVEDEDLQGQDLIGKYVKFDTIQLTPVVNRARQLTRNELLPDSRILRLGDLDFLFVDFIDIADLGRSLEMENYCEVASKKHPVGQHLAFPFVSHGHILSIDGDEIILKDVQSNATVTCVASGLWSTMEPEKRHEYEGKTVRFLAVRWYDLQDIGGDEPWDCEVFSLELEEDQGILGQERIIGRIRIHGPLNLLDVGADIPDGIPNLAHDDQGRVYFRYRLSDDPILRKYGKAVEEIRRIRQECRADAYLTGDDLIDPDKRTKGYCVYMMRKNKMWKEILFEGILFKDRDDDGEFAKHDMTTALHDRYPENEVHHALWFLTELGILNKSKNRTYRATKTCSDIVLLYIQKIGSQIDGLRTVSMLKAHDYGIPPSILLKHLRQNTLFSTAHLDGKPTELFWHSKGASGADVEDLAKNHAKVYEKIKEIMESVSHPVTAQHIEERMLKEGMHASSFAINMVLDEGIPGIGRDGGSWVLDLGERIIRMFYRYPDRTFSAVQILEEINIPRNRLDEILYKLSDLESSGFVGQLGGKWIFASALDKKVGSKVKEIILEALRRPVDHKNLVDRIKGRVAREIPEISGPERSRVIEQNIKELEKGGMISTSDGMVCRN